MTSYRSEIETREGRPDDAGELSTLLNEIIQIGGTTAYETLLTKEEFADYFLSGVHHISCFVAVDAQGYLAGFQTLSHHSKLPEGWADIATFARIRPKLPGAGTALFARTKNHAQQAGLTALNATIRADNPGGLIFYDKMGFQTYSVAKDVPLSDGTKIDRISKRLFLAG